MAVEFFALFNAIAPYVAQLASKAIPAFTTKQEANETDPVTTKQIEELQSAVRQNAESMQTLAEKLEQTIKRLEDAAQAAKNQASMYKKMVVASLFLAAVSLAISIFSVVK